MQKKLLNKISKEYVKEFSKKKLWRIVRSNLCENSRKKNLIFEIISRGELERIPEDIPEQILEKFTKEHLEN